MPAGLGHEQRLAGLAILAAGLGLFWLVYQLLLHAGGSVVDGAWQPTHEVWAFDLAAYLKASDRLVEQGSLYAADLLAGPFEPGPADLFYYPPPLGVALLPARHLDFGDLALLWWLLHLAALGLACALMPVRVILRVLAFAVVAFSLPGLKDPLLGNVSTLLLLPLVMAWRWLDRPLGSVALAIAMSVRPSLGVLLGWQLLRRRWRPALWTVAAGLVLVALTLPFVGIDGYRDFVAVIGNLDVPAGASENRDLGGLAMIMGADAGVIQAARLVSLALAVVAVLLGLRRDRELSFMVTVCASLLLVPLLWDHYLATLVLPAALLAQRWHVGLILLPLLAWLPLLAAPLVLATIVLLLRAPGSPQRAPAIPLRPLIAPEAADA